jgi:hypothetical protein
MLLGDVLAKFDDEAFASETVLRLGELSLLGRLREQAAAEDVSLGELARSAVRRFAAEADDEQWVSLLGAMGRTDDPGSVCLQRALAHVCR